MASSTRHDRSVISTVVVSALVAVSASLSSCSSSQDSTHSFSVISEDGIPTAVTEGGPRFSQDLFTFEEVLELQEGDTEDSQLFRPGDFFRDDKGLFYVMDGGNNRVAVFNRDGQYLRHIGREGSGPGEFQGASLMYLHEDTLDLYSLRQTRSTRFKTDGTLLDVTRLPGPLSLAVLACSRLDAQRGVYAKLGGNQVGRLQTWVEFGVFTSTGDTVWTGRTDPCETGVMESAEFQGMTVPQPRLYQLGASPTAAYHPVTGLIVSTGNEPELAIYGTDGELERVVRISLDPIPITDEQRSWVRMQFEEQLESSPESMKPLLRRNIEHLRFPNFRGYWDDIIIDAHGWIWLRIPEPVKYTKSQDAGQEYYVVSPSGEYMGTTRLPKGSRVSMSGGFLMANEGDLMGNDVRLVVYRMHPSPSGFEYP